MLLPLTLTLTVICRATVAILLLLRSQLEQYSYWGRFVTR
jgi:hypothetical protein